jgi:branched-chain amino acid transport system substrate-binding protein
MRRRTLAKGILGVSAVALLGVPARAADPIRIGFGMAQTGPLAANGKSALLAMEIWRRHQRQGRIVGPTGRACRL